jgi:hypothetical protein
MAEGVGFEPTLGFPLSLISSQVPSTTQPPFLRLVKSRFFDFATCVFDTAVQYNFYLRRSIHYTASRRQKTPVANLVRHVQSGKYYARIHLQGKLIWKSLKTDRVSVAKLRLSDFHKEEWQCAGSTGEDHGVGEK